MTIRAMDRCWLMLQRRFAMPHGWGALIHLATTKHRLIGRRRAKVYAMVLKEPRTAVEWLQLAECARIAV